MTPKGFFSYARGDDASMDSEVSALRARIANEISTLLGREIDMFQDVYDIRTGDDWEERLRDELTAASFMIPVLTPRYFERSWCREEVMSFVRLSEEAGRKPMLFPIYLVRDRTYKTDRACAVRKTVGRFQDFDFRDLRFEESDIRRNKAIHVYAEHLVDRLEDLRQDPPTKDASAVSEPSAADSKPRAETAHAPLSTVQPTAAQSGAEYIAPKKPPIVDGLSLARKLGGTPDKTPLGLKPQAEIFAARAPLIMAGVLVVDREPGMGDYTTVQAAIDAATPKSEIRVRPGVYSENLVLTKALHLQSDETGNAVYVRPSNGVALSLEGEGGSVKGIKFHKGLSLRDRVPALAVVSGTWAIEGCHFRSDTGHGAEVSGRTSDVTFLECEFSGGIGSGLMVKDRAKVVCDESRFNKSSEHGIYLGFAVTAEVDFCFFRGNQKSAIAVTSEVASALVHRNSFVGSENGDVECLGDAKSKTVLKNNTPS